MSRVLRLALALVLLLSASGGAAQSGTVDPSGTAPPDAPSPLDALVTQVTADVVAAVEALPRGDIFCAPAPSPTPRSTPIPSPTPYRAPVCTRRDPSFSADLREALVSGLRSLEREPVPACLVLWADMVDLGLRLVLASIDVVAEAVVAGGPTERAAFEATGPVGYGMLTQDAPALRKVLVCELPEAAA